MAAQLRLVRRRISSVQSIAKITRAQELIASSRIVRAQQQMRSAEPYARELTRAVEAVISRSTNVTHPFTQEAEHPSRAAVLIMTSDQGFAGLADDEARTRGPWQMLVRDPLCRRPAAHWNTQLADPARQKLPVLQRSA